MERLWASLESWDRWLSFEANKIRRELEKTISQKLYGRTYKDSKGMLAHRMAVVEFTCPRERWGTTPREQDVMSPGVWISGMVDPSRRRREMDPRRGPNCATSGDMMVNERILAAISRTSSRRYCGCRMCSRAGQALKGCRLNG